MPPCYSSKLRLRYKGRVLADSKCKLGTLEQTAIFRERLPFLTIIKDLSPSDLVLLALWLAQPNQMLVDDSANAVSTVHTLFSPC